MYLLNVMIQCSPNHHDQSSRGSNSNLGEVGREKGEPGREGERAREESQGGRRAGKEGQGGRRAREGGTEEVWGGWRAKEVERKAKDGGKLRRRAREGRFV